MARYMWNNVVLQGKNSLLFVEGMDDVRFFNAFLTYLRKDSVQVSAVGGKDEFRKALRAVKNARQFGQLKRLAVIRDSDAHPQRALQSLQDAVRAAGLPEPVAVGAQADTHPISVYIALVPGTGQAGSLEILLWELLPDSEKECIGKYLGCMSQLCKVRNMDKSRLYAYLAAGPMPDCCSDGSGAARRANAGLRLGESAEKGVWDWEDPAFIASRGGSRRCEPAPHGCGSCRRSVRRVGFFNAAKAHVSNCHECIRSAAWMHLAWLISGTRQPSLGWESNTRMSALEGSWLRLLDECPSQGSVSPHGHDPLPSCPPPISAGPSRWERPESPIGWWHKPCPSVHLGLIYLTTQSAYLVHGSQGSPTGSPLPVQQPLSRGPERARTEAPPAPKC